MDMASTHLNCATDVNFYGVVINFQEKVGYRLAVFAWSCVYSISNEYAATMVAHLCNQAATNGGMAF